VILNEMKRNIHQSDFGLPRANSSRPNKRNHISSSPTLLPLVLSNYVGGAYRRHTLHLVAAQPRTHPHREDALPYLEGVDTCIYTLHVDGRSQGRGRQHRDVQEVIIIVFFIFIVVIVFVFVIFVVSHV
jgi:hypothetical protein